MTQCSAGIVRGSLCWPETTITDCPLEDASIIILIQDLSEQGKEISSIKMTSSSEKPMMEQFELAYDETLIQKDHLYSISARISSLEGELLFLTDTLIPVISNGIVQGVKVPLVGQQGAV